MKPRVAFDLQERARKNLQQKVGQLRSSIEEDRDLDSLPTSLRQFNAWFRPKVGAESGFETNANETLARNSDIREAVIELLALVKSRRKKLPSKRETGLARVREQVRLHQTIRRIAEAEMSRARSESTTLREELNALRAQVRSIAEESTRIREQLENELATERKKVADLLKAKTLKIRVVK